jgi:pyruvate dehydrogenase E2 component (dihydrolipoamide acetyltransferase)
MTPDKKPFGADFPPWPQVDFAAYGEVEVKPVSRIQKFVSGFMARNWASIPHVTHHDEADITELERHRKSLADSPSGLRVTALAFFVKAVVAALKRYPQFNASLDADGSNLVLKKYFHIGIAVDTPNGLLVPVLRDCDKKGVGDIAAEIAAVSQRAREKGLPMADMSGGCFTISSLGGIGGSAFTPIINAPEVAILGITRSRELPARAADGSIDWRLMLPLDLSYDHRVINGADAARFCRAVADALAAPGELG